MKLREFLKSIFGRPLALPQGAIVKVPEIIQAVQEALDGYWQGSASLPPVSGVKVSLQTVRDLKLKAQGDYIVVALKGYHDKAVTEEIDLTLEPQKPGVAMKAVSTVTEALRNVIGAVQKNVEKYYPGRTNLTTKQIDVQISFSVTWDASISVGQKWALIPASIEAGGEYSSKTMHTITVTFG